MKNIIEKAVILALIGLMMSCSGRKSNNTPEYVLESFVQHFYNWQFKDCLQYTTAESETFLQFCASNMTEENINQIRALDNDASVEVLNINQENDSIVWGEVRIHSLLYADTIGKALKAKEECILTLKLLKENDVWKVDLTTPPHIKAEE